MALLDLNLPPVDEEEVTLEEGKPKTEIDYKVFPIKKRILMLWKQETMHDDLVKKKEEQEAKLLLSLPPKKRFCRMMRDRDDVCDDALKPKRQRVETAVSLDPKTPPLTESSNKSKAPLSRKSATGSSCPRIKNSCRSFDPRTVLVGQSSGSSFDASKLLPDYVKNNPEFQGMTEVKLVIQKTLKRADILSHQDRLSIPYKKIMTNFLTDSEFNWLEIKRPGSGKRRTVLVVKVMGPCSDNIHKLSLSRWNYKGNGYKFVITSGWTSFMNENNLKLNDLIQVVTFRVNNRRCFVILKPNTCSSSMDTSGLKR